MNQRKPKWEPSAPGHGGKLAPCPGVPCITYRVESIPWPLRPLTLPFDGLPFSLPIPFRTHNDNLIFVRRRRNAVYRVSVVDFIELAKRFPCSIDPFTYFSSWLACSAMGLASAQRQQSQATDNSYVPAEVPDTSAGFQSQVDELVRVAKTRDQANWQIALATFFFA